MGTLYYGAARTAVKIDDRVLSHLKLLIVSKLRRNEPFLLSWAEGADNGHGRSSVWIHESLDIVFRFDGGRQPELEKELLDRLSNEALAPAGVRIEASMPRFSSR